ncbi:MAG TPA: TIR domain-containing protein [Candidatus Methylomirabilis sp.]|nr:TIR domain-containing protein [Candidatus Methylomirabilis sp.]
MRYDAFISYAHAREGALAAALQKELQRLAKRWYQRRALRVFRDETNLAAAPGLWNVIAGALDDSRYLVLLASPEAAASQWVEREIVHWRTRKDSRAVLIVLCAGTLAWDPERRDFDWERTNALPRALSKAFSDEPLFVDLRGEAALDPARLRTAAARLAAPIHGIPFEDLLSEDLRAHRRALRLAWTTAAVLLVLAAAAVVASIQAVRSRNEASRQLQTANARRLALQGSVAERIEERADLGLLLAIESLRLEPSREALRVVLDTLNGLLDAEVYLRSAGRKMRGVAFSEDGARVSAVDEAGEVFTWEVASARRAPVTTRHPVAEASLHLSRDRREVVVEFEGEGVAVDRASGLAARAEEDGSVVVWRFDTRAPMARIVAHGPAVNALAFSPGGDLLATGGIDGALRVWSVRSGRLAAGPLRGHRAGEHGVGIRAVALSPGGRRLASAGDDGQVLLWDLAAQPVTHRLVKVLHSTANRLVFNWNGTLLAGAIGNLAELWDAERLETRWVLGAQSALVQDLAFSPDGRRIATASADGSVVLWALDDHSSLVRRFPGHDASVVAAAFIGGSLRARTLDYSRSLREWDLSTVPASSRASRLDSTPGPLAAFTADGRWLVTIENGGRELVRWDVERRPPERRLVAELPGAAASVAASTSRPCVVVATEEGDLRVFDLGVIDDPKHLLAARAQHPPVVVAVTPECDHVAGGYLGAGFSLWDVTTGVRRDIPEAHGGDVLGLAFDGRGLLATGGRGTIRLWRLADLDPLAPAFPAHAEGGPLALLFDSRTRRLVSSGGDARIHIWDLDAIAAGPLTFSDLERPAHALALSADGMRLLAGDNSKTVSLREVEPGLWTARACALVNRDLTALEWDTYLAPAPYRRTCGGAPSPGEGGTGKESEAPVR